MSSICVGESCAALAGANPTAKEYTQITLRTIDPAADRSQPFKFDACDKFLTLLLKAMISKIMTVIGVFSLFKRPKLEDESKSTSQLQVP